MASHRMYVDHEILQSTQHSQKYKVTEREACDLTTRGHKQDAPRPSLVQEKANVLCSALSKQFVAQILYILGVAAGTLRRWDY